MPHGISDGESASLRDAEQRKTLDPSRINYCFKITKKSIKRHIVHIPVGQAITARIKPNQRMISCESLQEMMPDGRLPIVFEMVHPIWSLHQGRAASNLCVGQANAIRCSAIANFLRHIFRVEID